MTKFMFATGIECSNPTIDNGRVRRDQLEECGHYARWEEDLSLVRGLGIEHLRYGLPIHRVHLGPGRYDWDFADMVLSAMRELGINPILDLLHFGLPDWIGDFQNPDFPELFADYAGAAVRRYPWIRMWTPVNEAFVTAKLSAREGLWNEQLRSERAFVTALKHLAQANILASHAIVKVRRDALIIPSESAEITHCTGRQCLAADLFNQLRFLSLDLLYGHRLKATMRNYLIENGMSEAELEWFECSPRSGEHVLGLDYYGHNEFIETSAGRRIPMADEGVYGFSGMGADYYKRYGMRIMLTETNMHDAERAPAWLWKQWLQVLKLVHTGVPVVGFTWYSLTDQVDWDIALAAARGKINPCGLYDLDRKPRPVAADYRDLIVDWTGAIQPKVTYRAATLKDI